ncbi:histidine--tRNA ligase [candidate division KSB1 bacterium]
MPDISARIFKGTRDFLPEEMRVREFILNKMKSVFRIYGFAPLETPAFEFLDILAGKYGDDAEKLLYPLKYKGGNTLALRYDLTVPLARVIAMNPHIPKPFKRYQIQPVWRADNPQLQRGRYREFYQCDVDTVGSTEPIVDAEIIALMADVFDELGFEDFEIRLNSRKILRGMIAGTGFTIESEQEVCRSIDKLEKEGISAVKNELLQKGYAKESIGKLIRLLDERTLGIEGMDMLQQRVPASEDLLEGLENIRSISTILDEMQIPPDRIVFDFALARGLDYYTGPIFEVVLPDKPETGSLAGGGRYDDLVGVFLKESVPAVGTSFGLERIHTLIKSNREEQNILHHDIDFLVCYFDETTRPNSLRLVRELRKAGLKCEMYFKPDKMKKQFGYADKKNIPFVVIAGPDEISGNSVKVKNMKDGDQQLYPADDWITDAKAMVSRHESE